MERKFMLLGLVLLTFCGGCASQMPLATNYPISTQKKARASHHWDVLADDVAAQTLAVTGKDDVLKQMPLYVLPAPENTPFNKAFRNFLITRMVSRGMQVTDQREGALEIKYETQLVRHKSNRYAHTPGTLTSLAAGIWVLRDIFTGSSGALPASVGLTGLADFAMGHYAGGPTPAELIVTTSIIAEDIYSMRKSDIYYIEDADTDLFVEAVEKVEQPVPLKKWDVVGK